MCLECHDQGQDATPGFVPHRPVADGDCTACHSPHNSAQEALLVVPSANLCKLCHEDIVDETGVRSLHAPAQDSCLDCHLAHGGQGRGFLAGEVPALCFTCHDESGSSFREAHQDRPADSLDCLGCHDPHKSTEPGLLHPNVHEPFADRDCSTCHEDGRQPVTDQLSLCLDCHDGLPPLEGEG